MRKLKARRSLKRVALAASDVVFVAVESLEDGLGHRRDFSINQRFYVRVAPICCAGAWYSWYCTVCTYFNGRGLEVSKRFKLVQVMYSSNLQCCMLVGTRACLGSTERWRSAFAKTRSRHSVLLRVCTFVDESGRRWWWRRGRQAHTKSLPAEKKLEARRCQG